MAFEWIKTYDDLAKTCGCKILCNSMGERYAITMELVSGELEDGDEIFQWYIIADPYFLIHHTDELVFYDSELDLYVWGVTHFGTSWDYVDAPEIIMDKKLDEDEE